MTFVLNKNTIQYIQRTGTVRCTSRNVCLVKHTMPSSKQVAWPVT